MCQDVKSEQTGSNSVGSSLGKAMASGNFAAAKQAMLNAFSTDQANVQKALGVIQYGAGQRPGGVQEPPVVRAAGQDRTSRTRRASRL